jgi:large subunit ribosomal protein L6
MSRIGNQPITIPGGVSFDLKGRDVAVKGPKGDLALTLRPEIDVTVDDGTVNVQTNGHGSARHARAFHGLTRALLSNMVVGVSQGFSKHLEIIGVGWNAKVQGKQLVLNIGFCHPVEFEVPAGLTVECTSPTNITVTGADKQAVGQLCARVRKVRPPEPYKGKGIRYKGEVVRRKAGKSFGS